MADKILKTRKQFTTTLRNDLYEALVDLSDETGIPKTRLIDQAVEMLLKEKYDVHIALDLKTGKRSYK